VYDFFQLKKFPEDMSFLLSSPTDGVLLTGRASTFFTAENAKKKYTLTAAEKSINAKL
jgi:hypothetical protein